MTGKMAKMMSNMIVIQNLPPPSAASTVKPLICAHCQQPFKGKTILVADQNFCCRGCGAAWSYIHELGLTSFYQLLQCANAATDAVVTSETALPKDSSKTELYDNHAFQASFVSPLPATQTIAATHEARLSLSGLTCYACAWLCEQAISRKFPGAHIEVNLSRGSARLTWNNNRHRLSELVELLDRLGFNPTPLRSEGQSGSRQELVQLGVAAVCTMNVMGFALAEYLTPAARPGDLNPLYFQLFRWLSLLVSLPAVSYGALPFYQAGLRFARQRRISIDQAIAFSILISFGFSAWNTLRGEGAVYFDSICAGITLLLGGRIVQKIVLRRAEDAIRNLYRPAESFVRLLNPHHGPEEMVPVSQIATGNQLRILPGELIPVSGIVTMGSGEVSAERITGEPGFSSVAPDSQVIGGSTNGPAPLVITAIEDGGTSWISSAQKSIDAMLGERSRFTVMTEKFATWFFVLVAACAMAALAIWWQDEIDQAFSRAVAIILIACPCAFGVAAPITLAAGAARALRDGVVFRHPTAIERLAAVKKVFFDKTGTLTAGRLTIKKAEIFDSAARQFSLDADDVSRLVGALSRHSSHQWATALHEWGEKSDNNQLENFREVFGLGLQAEWRGHHIRLGSRKFVAEAAPCDQNASTFLAIDHAVVAAFYADDELLPEAAHCVRSLRSKGLEVAILSGDQTGRTRAVAKQLGIKEFTGELSPEAKLTMATPPIHSTLSTAASTAIAAPPPYAMIGNGFNDSLAMAGSFVGIAVFGSAPAAREAADVFIAEPGLHRVTYTFAHARATMRTLTLAYGFAGVYNVAGVVLAFSGLVTPGVAAAMMPIASLVIVRIATLDLGREIEIERES